MNYFTTVKYSDNLYQIKDALGVLTTLVIGKDKALLLDTGYGIGNLYEEVRKITKKELIVVDSHGHMDHACGNYQFKEVYISKDDLDIVKEYNSCKWRERNIKAAIDLGVLPDNFDIEKYKTMREGNLKEIKPDSIIDLGDLHLEVIKMEGHTKGSIGLLIKEWKILLVADATCPFVWLFLKESTSVKTYIKMLERTLKLDFDYFLVGHGAKLFKKEEMVKFLNVAKDIKLDKSVKVSFNNFEELNSYCYTLGEMYNQNDCGVVFDPNKLD